MVLLLAQLVQILRVTQVQVAETAGAVLTEHVPLVTHLLLVLVGVKTEQTELLVQRGLVLPNQQIMAVTHLHTVKLLTIIYK